MSNDNLFRTLFNAGELLRSADLMDVQRQLMHQIYSMRTLAGLTNPFRPAAVTTIDEPDLAERALLSGDGPLDVALCPYPSAGYVVPGAGARELTVGTPGPVCQLLSAGPHDPGTADVPLLSYWIGSGEFTLTTAVGDATNPRVDLVEMKLEIVEDASASVSFSIESVKATLDCGPLTSNYDGVLRLRNGGAGGNNYRFQLVNDGVGAGTLETIGTLKKFHYQSGVTTCAQLEAAIALDDSIEVQASDAVGTLTHPGDTFGPSSFAGGVNQKIASQTVNKKRRVQATFQIKAGTPAATPAHPTPTAGFVPICAVFVPALHNAVHTVTNLSDMRWPIGGVRPYDVDIQGMNPQASAGTIWTLSNAQHTYTSPAPSASLWAGCPMGGNVGRLVGVGIQGFFPGTFTATLARLATPGTAAYTNLVNMSTFLGGELSAAVRMTWMSALSLMDNLTTPATRGTRAANTRVGAPIWTNGHFCGPALRHGQSIAATGAGTGNYSVDRLGFLVNGTTGANVVSLVRFYVAHGLG